jgi:hypothetical protein
LVHQSFEDPGLSFLSPAFQSIARYSENPGNWFSELWYRACPSLCLLRSEARARPALVATRERARRPVPPCLGSSVEARQKQGLFQVRMHERAKTNTKGGPRRQKREKKTGGQRITHIASSPALTSAGQVGRTAGRSLTISTSSRDFTHPTGKEGNPRPPVMLQKLGTGERCLSANRLDSLLLPVV